MYKYTDYFKQYGRIMQFNQNKQEPIHRWYPFVEGYSKEFISSIIGEFLNKPQTCLEPFSGSGTTALELQNRNIRCYSFEVNPFMYLLASVKLEDSYDFELAQKEFEVIKKRRFEIDCQLPNSIYPTLYENGNRKKWNYHHNVSIAIQKLKLAISEIEDEIYRNLFIVALASILLDISNLYRNGKCLSYKSEWQSRRLSEQDVFDRFDSKITSCILPDIKEISRTTYSIKNKNYLYHDDARSAIDNRIADNSVDLVITSPPYLNSRDYTDTYMLELKTLDMTPTFDSITALRKRTIRSHVQINWTDTVKETDPLLLSTLEKLGAAVNNATMWNNSILDMINLYFVDMRKILKNIYGKLNETGKVFFNVSNSAYFGVLVNTLEICSSIASSEGFHIEEIRKARLLKTSPQQKEAVGSLLEGVIVMNK